MWRNALLIPILGVSVGLAPLAAAQERATQTPVVATPVSVPADKPVDRPADQPAAKPAEPAPGKDANAVATPAAPAAAPTLAPAAAPAKAAEPTAPTPPAVAAPAVPPAPEPAPVVAAPAAPSPFALDIAAAAGALAPKGTPDKAELAAIVAFYAARNGSPLWVDKTGRTKDGAAVVAEIGRAGDWGLDPAQLDAATLGAAPSGDPTDADRAADEVRIAQAVLKYARYARGGRIDPSSLTKFLDRKPELYEPASVLEQIARASDPAAYLRALHPKHPQFERLRQLYLSMLKAKAQAATLVKIPDGPAIKPGASHAHVALVRARLGVAVPKPVDDKAVDETLYDQTLVDAVKAFQAKKDIKPANGLIGNSTRAALNNVAQGNPRKILANMEQWRWMPDDLGSFHVWVNVPEFTLRVVRDGKVIHTERIVAGKTDTQTPIFSHAMEQVIFHPFWGVPDGIKRNEIQPSLAAGRYDVLARHGLRIQASGRDIDPSTVDWRASDLRRFHVYQPPGNSNVLGVVKFRFPNKHDVYMHDTPTKGLFSNPVRAYSHGCMRVRDPVRLAELILAEDRSMPATRVRALAAPGATPNNQINLTRHIPVHMTYFTATVDDEAKPHYFTDIYGHENRIALALEGKAHLIAKVPEAKGPAQPVARLSETLPSPARGDWAKRAFGDN